MAVIGFKPFPQAAVFILECSFHVCCDCVYVDFPGAITESVFPLSYIFLIFNIVL